MLPNDFWESNDRCHDQKFYTAFCILEVACSDYAVGVKLKRERRLNWACTVLYYSLVHAARLICFVKMGDFPIGHKELGDLFSRGTLRVGHNRTWVGKKLQPYAQKLGIQVDPIQVFCLRDLSPANPNKWGQILEKARKLRDDANYEGLLISHEYSHVRVTDCFQQLGTALRTACKGLLPDMVSLFITFIDSSPRRDYWYAFLNWRSGHSDIWTVSSPVGEGLYYLEASLKYRGVNEKLMTEVLTWLEELRREPDVDVQKAAEVHDNIVMSAFGMKSSLMQDFEREIQKFCQLIDRNQR